MADPYKDASEWAIEQARHELEGQDDPLGVKLVAKAAYWSAWRGARNAAAALLNKAEEVSVTKEQFQALTEVAEEVAYD